MQLVQLTDKFVNADSLKQSTKQKVNTRNQDNFLEYHKVSFKRINLMLGPNLLHP